MEQRIKIDSIPQAVRKVRQWCASQHGNLCVLDSCNVPSVENLGEWEILCGVDLQTKYALPHDERADWSKLDHLGQSWNFFVLSYDLKNSIESLTSENPSFHQWPEMLICEAKTVVGVTKAGELYLYGGNTNQILNSIENPATLELDESKGMNPGWSKSIERTAYLHTVQAIRDEIEMGNVYEMNLCVESTSLLPADQDAFQLFQRLTNISPTPFAAYLSYDGMNLISASPERYLYKRGDRVYSQPIKGTSPRGKDKIEDDRSFRYLRTSEKEKAEHVMIVDLVRNDLSRFCVPGTVRVDDLFGVYSYAQVHQMISTVKGRVKGDTGLSEIVRSTFPMGSMTGAPKVSAMQHIERFENHRRGWYSGSVGYIDPSGNMDSNVIIRSLLYDAVSGKASFSVGGAITYDSDPEMEYEECELKASAIRSLTGS